MKNRKKQFLKLGIILLAIAVTGTVAGIIQYKKANQFDLTVAEHVISKEEYLNCMKAVEYDGKHGYEILADNTVEELKHIHAVYDLAKEQGDITDSSYEALEKRWKDENAERSEKVEKGEVIYGLKEYTFQLYLDYEISTLKEKYCNDTNREGMKLTEDEIQEHYQSREWIFGDSDENADLEMARIAVERELREQKYDDMITQRETGSQVAGNMENVNRITLKNIQ